MPKQRATREPPHEAEPTIEAIAGRTPSPGDSATSQTVNDSPSPSLPPHGNHPAIGKEEPADRAGVDTRQRGWYWHWNGIVTQYAPLIGLKGVGLLNSYTVWTDRREQSPTRGFAFPSQQAEAAFYGEDRSELITINKILVALDLIEIRKEMVRRVDERGRKWKVPRNLYRVKDRPEGLELRTRDVLRVTELASRDAAVFRYVKRIFSSRFAPIDRDNVWHRILTEVASDPTWQAMTDKTAKIDARASARTRAGHKARNKKAAQPAAKTNTREEMTAGHSPTGPFDAGKHDGKESEQTETTVAATNAGFDRQETSVAATNTGSGGVVDTGNRGFESKEASSVETTNNGRASVVAPGNAMYYQETSTTTTTTVAAETEQVSDVSPQRPPGPGDMVDAEGRAAAPAQPAGMDDGSAALYAADESVPDPGGLATTQWGPADSGGVGPVVDPGPLVISLFEAANDRRATPLERMLLGELARDAEPAARACGEAGTDWVAAALREAVSSGSAFVAPKRLREIINRWASTGSRPGVDAIAPPSAAQEADRPVAKVRLPRGRSAARVWSAVLDEFAQVLDSESHDRLFQGSEITDFRDGVLTIAVNAGAQSKLAGEYRPMLQRYLERQLGREVSVDLRADAVTEAESSAEETSDTHPIEISRADAEQGQQLWRAVLAEIAPVTSADDLVRLRGTVPLGQDAEGHIVVGAPSALAVRLIRGRCLKAIESALTTLLGNRATVNVIESGAWRIRTETSGSADG